MSTVTNHAPKPVGNSADDDPFLHGVRHVPRTLADGTIVYDEIPLRQEDLLFPEEWDRHVITQGHHRDCQYLHNVFTAQLKEFAGWYVMGDLRVDWSHPEIRPLGPDVIVVGGVQKEPDWKTFSVVDEGATTVLVGEVTSPDTRNNDLVIKRDLYYRLGVTFYFIVDRHERRDSVEVAISVFRHGDTEYEELPRNDRGWIWLEPLKVWLGVEGDRAICYRADGAAIPEYAEAMDALSGAEHRAAEAVVLVERERQRAENAEQAAQTERDRTAALELRIRELEAKLGRDRDDS